MSSRARQHLDELWQLLHHAGEEVRSLQNELDDSDEAREARRRPETEGTALATPRVNAATFWLQTGDGEDGCEMPYVDRDVAQSIERELLEAQDELRRARRNLAQAELERARLGAHAEHIVRDSGGQALYIRLEKFRELEAELERERSRRP